jgi:hypothetical protein
MGLFSKRKSSSSENIDWCNLPGPSDFYCGTGQAEQLRVDVLWELKLRLLLEEGLIMNEEFKAAWETGMLHKDSMYRQRG